MPCGASLRHAATACGGHRERRAHAAAAGGDGGRERRGDKGVETSYSFEEAGYADQAASLDTEMVGVALEALTAHLDTEGDLRSIAIEQGLIEA